MSETIKSTNITWHHAHVTKQDREQQNGHRSVIVWFTGLSGSGKSTVANALDAELFQRGVRSFVLDGDNIRHGLNKNVGFSPADREENIRRIGEVAKLFTEAGMIAMTAFISPYRADRDKVRALVAEGDFVEVYVRCGVDACESRDTKGLYKKARAGEIKEFTGISAPYEEPLNPELILDTDKETLEESCEKVLRYLLEKSVLTK